MTGIRPGAHDVYLDRLLRSLNVVGAQCVNQRLVTQGKLMDVGEVVTIVLHNEALYLGAQWRPNREQCMVSG